MAALAQDMAQGFGRTLAQGFDPLRAARHRTPQGRQPGQWDGADGVRAGFDRMRAASA
ncbi:hypothetical protein [Azospirillum doebereinerae]